MIYAFLRYGGEVLFVFAENSADDAVGPYQDLAPGLLALPEGRVTWLAEDPSGRLLVRVPAQFITALIEMRADDAAMLLGRAVAACYAVREGSGPDAPA